MEYARSLLILLTNLLLIFPLTGDTFNSNTNVVIYVDTYPITWTMKKEKTCGRPVTSRDARGNQETTSPTISTYPNPFNDKVKFVIESPVS